MGWQCVNCGSRVDEGFQVCWNCGTDRHGNIDPEFSIESDPETLTDDPEVPRIRCRKCGYHGKVLFTNARKNLLDWIVAAAVSLLVSQRSWIHLSHQVCPRCGAADDDLVGWSGSINHADEETWRTASAEEDRRATQKRRLIYLILAAATTALVAIWLALH